MSRRNETSLRVALFARHRCANIALGVALWSGCGSSSCEEGGYDEPYIDRARGASSVAPMRDGLAVWDHSAETFWLARLDGDRLAVDAAPIPRSIDATAISPGGETAWALDRRDPALITLSVGRGGVEASRTALGRRYERIVADERGEFVMLAVGYEVALVESVGGGRITRAALSHVVEAAALAPAVTIGETRRRFAVAASGERLTFVEFSGDDRAPVRHEIDLRFDGESGSSAGRAVGLSFVLGGEDEAPLTAYVRRGNTPDLIAIEAGANDEPSAPARLTLKLIAGPDALRDALIWAPEGGERAVIGVDGVSRGLVWIDQDSELSGLAELELDQPADALAWIDPDPGARGDERIAVWSRSEPTLAIVDPAALVGTRGPLSERDGSVTIIDLERPIAQIEFGRGETIVVRHAQGAASIVSLKSRAAWPVGRQGGSVSVAGGTAWAVHGAARRAWRVGAIDGLVDEIEMPAAGLAVWSAPGGMSALVIHDEVAGNFSVIGPGGARRFIAGAFLEGAAEGGER